MARYNSSSLIIANTIFSLIVTLILGIPVGTTDNNIAAYAEVDGHWQDSVPRLNTADTKGTSTQGPDTLLSDHIHSIDSRSKDLLETYSLDEIDPFVYEKELQKDHVGKPLGDEDKITALKNSQKEDRNAPSQLARSDDPSQYWPIDVPTWKHQEAEADMHRVNERQGVPYSALTSGELVVILTALSTTVIFTGSNRFGVTPWIPPTSTAAPLPNQTSSSYLGIVTGSENQFPSSSCTDGEKTSRTRRVHTKQPRPSTITLKIPKAHDEGRTSSFSTLEVRPNVSKYQILV